MKRIVKSLVNGFLSPLGYEIVRSPRGRIAAQVMALQESGSIKATQISLVLQYRNLVAEKMPLPKISDTGFRVYSQTDEDGIILFLFSVIGTKHKTFIEIGAGDGMECNCANLALNFGWHGLFIDSDEEKVVSGTKFYGNHPDTRIFPPNFISARVNRQNVNDEIRGAGFRGEIDLLSIDVDGMDYWIWESIECVNARVVVVEANGKFGMRSITVPYDDNWTYDPHGQPHYHGASLPAITKLATAKGYRLVGTNRFGFNAFYLRNDTAQEMFPAVTVESCRAHTTRENDEKIFQRIRHLPYIEV